MKLITLTCAAIVSLMPLVSANADTDIRKQTVSYADLDLSHAAGLAVLFNRVRSAAEAVCEDPSSRTLIKRQKDCVQQAVANAVQSINRPEFLAYVAGHGGLSVAVPVASR